MNPKYARIIDLARHEPAKHPRMSREQRAAQFSPFAALAGYAEALDEARRSHEGEFARDASCTRDEEDVCAEYP